MKTKDIIQSIKDNTFEGHDLIPKEIKTHELMSISDMHILKELARNREKFQILRKTETWPDNGVRQLILGEMDKFVTFLRYIDSGDCRCIKYQFIKPDPVKEEALGLVEITKKVQHARVFEISYECKCTLCHTIFICHSAEERFHIGYYWRRKPIQ